MIFVPVDLFSPYIRGREQAIERNWNDLNQSNQVEQGWLNNDARQLNNWFAEDTYGDRLLSSNAQGRVSQNQAIGSDLNTQIAQVGQPGALAQAQLAADYQQALLGSTQPYVAPIARNNALFSYGQSADLAAQGNAALNTAPQFRAATANNNLAAANLQGQAIQGNASLLPLQQDVQRGNLELQQAINNQFQQNPQALFPQPAIQPGVGQTPTASTSDTQIYSLAAGLPVGRTVELSIGGAAVTAGRDNNGVFVMEQGLKRYLQPAQSAPTSTFSFEGLD